MATLNLTVVASLDDAYSGSGGAGYDDSSTNMLMKSHATAWRKTMARFLCGAISSGDTIDAATYSVYVYNTGFDDVNGTMRFEDADAANESDAADRPDQRVLTDAGVAWVADGLGVGYQSPADMKVAAQEVVDRGGFNGVLNVIFDPNLDVEKLCYVRTFDYGSNEPKLDITYTPAAGLSIPIAMHHYKQLHGAA